MELPRPGVGEHLAQSDEYATGAVLLHESFALEVLAPGSLPDVAVAQVPLDATVHERDVVAQSRGDIERGGVVLLCRQEEGDLRSTSPPLSGSAGGAQFPIFGQKHATAFHRRL